MNKDGEIESFLKNFIVLDMIYEEILLYHFEDFKKEYEFKKSKGLSVIKHILENDNSKLIVNKT